MEFEIVEDKTNENAWFIRNVETHHVLNIDDVNDSEYKKMFAERGENDTHRSTFSDRKSAQKVLDNLYHIYKI